MRLEPKTSAPIVYALSRPDKLRCAEVLFRMLRADIEQMIARNGTNDQTRNGRSNGENEHSKNLTFENQRAGNGNIPLPWNNLSIP